MRDWGSQNKEIKAKGHFEISIYKPRRKINFFLSRSFSNSYLNLLYWIIARSWSLLKSIGKNFTPMMIWRHRTILGIFRKCPLHPKDLIILVLLWLRKLVINVLVSWIRTTVREHSYVCIVYVLVKFAESLLLFGNC